MTTSVSDSILPQSLRNINQFYYNQCASGLINQKAYTGVSRMAREFDHLYEFEIVSNNLIKSDYKRDDCIIGEELENVYLNFEIGYANSGLGIDESLSYTLFLSFSSPLQAALTKQRQEIYEQIYENNFLVYDYLDENGELKVKAERHHLDLREINQYDLKAMINFFIEDYNKRSTKVRDKEASPKTYRDDQVEAFFETLEGQTIAQSFGMNNDSKILIKVDPEKWANASKEKRWYVLYHELGHDVLNLEHGEDGKMMFNFTDRDYSWEEFVKDKNYMLQNN
jgi:hypothetical protein